MAIDLAPELLDILACPNCHGSLAVDHDRDELVCLAADCGLAYPVRQGIPVLLIDEARRPGPDLPPPSAVSAASAADPTTAASAADPTTAAGADASSNGSASAPGSASGPVSGPATGASATDADERP